MKKSFITGLVILLPTALTLIIAMFLFNLFTRPFVPIVETILNQFSFSFSREATLLLSRLIALIFLFIFILILGMIAQHFLFTSLANVANYILFRIPLVNTIYKTSRDILAAIFSPDGKQAFKEAVAVPFPTMPHQCVGLSSGEAPIECEEKAGEPLISVFAPTAPHPISGFLFLVPARDVQSLDMTKEDAIKFLLSCGVIHPASRNAMSLERLPTRVILFQVRKPHLKLSRVVETASMHFGRKEHLLILAEDEKGASYVDELLWKFPPTSFLPHVCSEEETPSYIAITRGRKNVNRAKFAFNLCPTPLLIEEVRLIYDFEDLTSPLKQQLSAVRFDAYKRAGFLIEAAL